MKKGGKAVFLGMSGGVDSSVAAVLLKREGYNVRGVFMKNWADPKYPCPWEDDRRDAMRVAAILDIPFETWNFTKEYRGTVVEYMIREYAAGCTPNPDVMCNREIKFGLFLRRALKEGADFVATGHYVKKVQSPKSKVQNLAIAKDLNKDQSYFLWTLTQNQLQHSLFPIGNYLKSEVRQIAREAGLPTAEKPDSQGVCFVGEIDVAAFLRDHIPAKRGLVVTTSGKKVGEHDGAMFYTIGQRHGLGVGGGIPFYVAAKDTRTNTLVVAEGPNDGELFRRELIASDLNWINGEPRFPLRCEARIRYRQPLQKARIMKHESGSRKQKNSVMHGSSFMIHVEFDSEQRAVTPGQSVVFYKDGVMLGGGIIS
ncbi:MAG: tRNA 2-thiouridine(34) synthase MnmA [Candidatus Sungbacteria bacterium]|nr:tRNA 2-thiouridine(34) synthase MnmA [Candidatus Sungbacteria bacterium]